MILPALIASLALLGKGGIDRRKVILHGLVIEEHKREDTDHKRYTISEGDADNFEDRDRLRKLHRLRRIREDFGGIHDFENS